MSKKLILPAEMKICATCAYWDGARKVDTELQLVVVDENCSGECLVQSEGRPALNDELDSTTDCLWEHLETDEVLEKLDPSRTA